MLLELLTNKFETIIFLSIILITLGIILLLFLYKNDTSNNKLIITNYIKTLDSSYKEIKDYMIGIGNILDQQKNEILKLIERISSLEREINRITNIKGTEDILGVAIEMARSGESRESIKNKTNLRDDEIEAVYTYYRK